MEQKKNSKFILITIIILSIFILMMIIGYICFATDIFKSKKEVFFQYCSQIGNEEQGLFDTQLKQYFDKKKQEIYENQGTIQLVTENQNANQYTNVKDNFNISFSGKTQENTKSLQQDISLNYSDEVNFPISFRKIGNTIGFQTQYVGNKYIAIETDNLEDKNYEGIGQLIKEMPNFESLQQLSVSKDEWKKIQETYLNVIMNQLQESQFEKVKENNQKGYKLKIDGQQFKNILISLLETLKNDQSSLDKINEYMKAQKKSTRITANSIDNNIKDIQENTELEENIYEITLYREKGKITKLSLETNDAVIQIEKTKQQDSLQYIIILSTVGDEQNETITFKANYTGLSMETQEISENYEFQIQNYKYQYNNLIKFTNADEIEQFSDENAMILNNYEDEQVNNFLGQVEERFKLVNQKQMEELGLEENENPLWQILSPILETFIKNQAIKSMTNSSNNISEIEVNTFNQKFENYESTNLRGTTVKGLFTTIQSHNEIQENNDKKIKEIHFDGEEYEVTDQNIAYLKSSIEMESYYRVEFEKDEDTGLIYRAVINKK